MLDKYKQALLSANYVLLSFILLTIRVTLFGAQVGEALTILSICSLLGFAKYLKSKEAIPLNEEVRRELDDIKGAVIALKLSNTRKPQNESETISKRFF